MPCRVAAFVAAAVLAVFPACRDDAVRPDAGAAPSAQIDVIVNNDSGATRVFIVTAQPPDGAPPDDLMSPQEMKMNTVRETRNQQVLLPSVLRLSVVYTWDQSRVIAEHSISLPEGTGPLVCRFSYSEPIRPGPTIASSCVTMPDGT